jgi:hypothetical protein
MMILVFGLCILASMWATEVVVTPKEKRWKHAPKREFTRRQRRAEARDWARVSWALQEPP